VGSVGGVSDDDPSRDPPKGVKEALRQEVGFGCPMRDVGTDYCGSPYLTYHHFDPPWAEEHHQDPARMIALCATHHLRADALTVDQCKELKETALSRAGEIAGRFDWLRRDMLAVVGGDYYYETPTLIRVGDRPLVWFNRDEQNRLLLNLDTPDAAGTQRVSLRDNDWIVRGDPTDVESPPMGRRLTIRYADGDRLVVKFREWKNEAELIRWHPSVQGVVLNYPLTTVEIYLRLQGLNIDLEPRKSRWGGVTTNIFFSNNTVGVQIN
jgi:hypothetical protein